MLRRVWAKRGVRPVAEHNSRYEWLYVYGFVHPSSGRTDWLIVPTVNTAAFSAALASFKRCVDPRGEKLIVLLVDNAGWHLSKGLEVPEGVELEFLPPYTPELQPAERLWPPLREAVANTMFATLEALQAALEARCLELGRARDYIKGATSFHWLPVA